MRRSCNRKCTSIGVILVLIGCGASLTVAFRSADRSPSLVARPRGNFMNFFSNMMQQHSETDCRARPNLFQPLNHNKEFSHWGQYQRPVQQPDYERNFYNFGGQRDYAYSDDSGDDFSCQEPNIPKRYPYGERDSENANQGDICDDKDYGIRWKGSPPDEANIEIDEVISKGDQGDCDSPLPEDEIPPKMVPSFNGRPGVDIHNCFPVVGQGRSEERNDSSFKTTGNEYFVLVIKKDHLLGDARKLNKTEISIDDILGMALRPNATAIPPTSESFDESSRQSPSTDDQESGKHPTQFPASSIEISTSSTTDKTILQATDGPTKITIFKNPKLRPTQFPASRPKTLASTSRIAPDEVVSQSFDETTKISLFENPTFQAANNPESVLNDFLKDFHSFMKNPTLIVIPPSKSNTSDERAQDAETDSLSTVPAGSWSSPTSSTRPIGNNRNGLTPNEVQADSSQSLAPGYIASTSPITMTGTEAPKLGVSFGSKSKVTANDKNLTDVPVSQNVPEDTQMSTSTVANDASPVLSSSNPSFMDSGSLNDSMSKVDTSTPTITNTTTFSPSKADTRSRVAATGNGTPAVVASPTSRNSDSRHSNESVPIIGKSTPRVKNIAAKTDSQPRPTTIGDDIPPVAASPNPSSFKDDSQSAVLKTDLATDRVPKMNETPVKKSKSTNLDQNRMSSTPNGRSGTTLKNGTPSVLGPISELGVHDLGDTIKGLQDFVHKLMSTGTPLVNSEFGPGSYAIQETTPNFVGSSQSSEQAPANKPPNIPKAAGKVTKPGTDGVKKDFGSNSIVSAKNPRLKDDDAKIGATTPTISPVANSRSPKSNLRPNSVKGNGKSPRNQTRTKTTAPVMKKTQTVVPSSQSPKSNLRPNSVKGNGKSPRKQTTAPVMKKTQTDVPSSQSSVTSPRTVMKSIPKRSKTQPIAKKDSSSIVRVADSKPKNSTVNGAVASSNKPIITDKNVLLSVTTPKNKATINLASSAIPSLRKPTIVNGNQASGKRTPLNRNSPTTQTYNPDKNPVTTSSQSSDLITSRRDPAYDLIGSQLTTKTTNTAIDEEVDRSKDDFVPATFTEHIYNASSFTTTIIPVETSTVKPRQESQEPNTDETLSLISKMGGKKSPRNSAESGGSFDPGHKTNNASSIVNSSEQVGTPFKWGSRLIEEEEDVHNRTSTVKKSSLDDTVKTNTQSSANKDRGVLGGFNDSSPIVNGSEFSSQKSWWANLRGYRNSLSGSSNVNGSSARMTFNESPPSTDSNRSSVGGITSKTDDDSRIVDDLEQSKKQTSWFSKLRNVVKGQNKHTSIVNGSQPTDVIEADSKVMNFNDISSTVQSNKSHNKTESGVNAVNDEKPSVGLNMWTKFKGIFGDSSTITGLNGTNEEMVSSQSANLQHNSTASTTNEDEDDATMEIMITEPPGGWSSWLTVIQAAKDTSTLAVNETTQPFDNRSEAKSSDTSTKRQKYSHFHGSDFEVWSGENEGL